MLKKIRQLAQTHSSPRAVQKYLRQLPYNWEPKGETFRSATAGLRHGKLHCAEAALLAAMLLEGQGYPPLLLVIDSKDGLCHVLFVFRSKGKWGAIGRSRDEGLHGRRPRFRSLRDLVWSYFDAYVDKTGRVIGFKCIDLSQNPVDWRFSKKNLWSLERLLIGPPMQRLRSSQQRYQRLLRRYKKHGPLPRQNDWW